MTTKTWSEAVGEEKNYIYVFGDDDLGVLSCWSTFDDAKKEFCRYMHIDTTEFDEQITYQYNRYELCQDAPEEDVVPVWIDKIEIDTSCFVEDYLLRR